MRALFRYRTLPASSGLLALVCLLRLAGVELSGASGPAAPPPVASPPQPAGRPELITTDGGLTIIRPRYATSGPPIIPGVTAVPAPPGQTSTLPTGASVAPASKRAVPQVWTPPPATPADALVFDAETKEYTAKPGEISVNFTFNVTNTSKVEVTINNVLTSCGCTVARLPQQPWRIAPGTGGPIGVAVDLRGKRGLLMKSVTVQGTSGGKNLLLKVTIPDERTGFVDTSSGGMLDADRVKNIQLSLADRQAIFKKKDCAECHADKAAGKTGKELYDVICAICHDTPHRASMVTDFKERRPYTPEIWRQWITFGKTNTLMPAFAMTEGGPLTHAQISSLVDYLVPAFQPGAQPSLPPDAPASAQHVVPPARPVPASPMVRPPALIAQPPPVPPVPPPPARTIGDYPFPK